MKGKLVIILSILLLACPVSAKKLTGTLKHIKKTGQIRIGYRASEPPMSFMNEYGTPVGYSIDLSKFIVKEVAKKIGKDVKVVYVPVTAKNRFTALMNNKIDLLRGSTTKTLLRCEPVDFTELIFVTGASLMTLKDNKFEDIKELNGKKSAL